MATEAGALREIKAAEHVESGHTATVDLVQLREQGKATAARWKNPAKGGTSTALRSRFDQSLGVLAGLQHALRGHQHEALSEDLKWLSDHLRLYAADTIELRTSMKKLQKLPLVRSGESNEMPRSWVLMRAFMEATNFDLREEALVAFVDGAIEVDPLEYKELWALGEMLKLVLFDETAKRGQQALQALGRQDKSAVPVRMDLLVQSLRLVGEMNWEEMVEPLSPVNRIFQNDPAGIYPRMDELTRAAYLTEISDLAKGSHASEVEIARLAIRLAADEKNADPAADRQAFRRCHIGYYLVGEGASLFRDRIGFRPTFDTRLQILLRRYPDEFYILFIEFLTLITIAGIIFPFSHGRQPLSMLLLMAILLFLPVTQAAVELVNYFITSILKPKPLPKLDFSEGVPDDCKTLVTVPTLLINEKQIQQLVEDLEIRYLGNQDRNIHYALLTDLPDSAEAADEHDHRIEYAIRLLSELNEKYGHLGQGQFFLFHRHRVYNPQERTWMGWERKRGKLLDLNKLLRHAHDPFPVKLWDRAAVEGVRFVITLDSDTQLPRGSAARMIGTIAHPLNSAVIDPRRNVVVNGYGILQPRVGISVPSAGRSRLAALYSGQTGFDIYTRAVSDVYQDLYEEGIFTGKGIYDVDALRAVLESRFPRNTLLSHDLIEGAYARAGLLSDVEVIDDYPSHYSAYNRRKHRWLRGDWQIVRWLFPRVPDETGRLVQNPISLVSRWKIFDNLRRSTVEPALFILLVAGWLFLPGGPMTWTCVVASLLFLPGLFQFLFGLFRFARLGELTILRDAAINLGTSIASVMLNVIFLAHQAMVALDAIVRTVIRSTITRRSMLEWETATEAELGLKKRTPVDMYLDWMPLVALLLGLLVAYFRPKALPYALPVLVLWACAKLVSNWLNRPPLVQAYQVSAKDRALAKNTFLKTWRFFADFSNEGNHWLIPDNVQENQPDAPMIAERISTTNLGFLVNARQAACALGSLTITELVKLTGKTMLTVMKLERHQGQLYNWYDNITLQPLEPRFISTVDNGNLVASLWSLKQGFAEEETQPMIRPVLADGLMSHLELLRSLKVIGRSEITQLKRLDRTSDVWVTSVLQGAETWFSGNADRSASPEASWWIRETRNRIAALRDLVNDFAPWLLPELSGLQEVTTLNLKKSLVQVTPAGAAAFYRDLEQRIEQALIENRPSTIVDLLRKLRERLPNCIQQTELLRARLSSLVEVVGQLAEGMNFAILFEPKRKLLSIGYNVSKDKLETSCYDLMASEARIASFISVAKGEIPQESWFRLGRTHTIWEGETVLASWTGTMFEYLMPALWMKLYANTLLDRSAHSALHMQQMYAHQFHVPWGISESGYSEQSPEGHYQYRAFGVPPIALKNPTDTPPLVISPYSSWLALMVDPEAALVNASKMASLGWTGTYGFYEAADYGVQMRHWFRRQKPAIVRMWMAHHQGMILLALANWLGDEPFVRWFHSERRVQATELLLQEKPLRSKPLPSIRPDLARLAHVQRWKAAV